MIINRCKQIHGQLILLSLNLIFQSKKSGCSLLEISGRFSGLEFGLCRVDFTVKDCSATHLSVNRLEIELVAINLLNCSHEFFDVNLFWSYHVGVQSINATKENAVWILLQDISLVLLLGIRLFFNMILTTSGSHICDDLLSLGI